MLGLAGLHWASREETKQNKTPPLTYQMKTCNVKKRLPTKAITKSEFTPHEINFIEQFDKNFKIRMSEILICMFEILKEVNEGTSSTQK